jgi:hypothetical protein
LAQAIDLALSGAAPEGEAHSVLLAQWRAERHRKSIALDTAVEATPA